jgi:hypothetical protein
MASFLFLSSGEKKECPKDGQTHFPLMEAFNHIEVGQQWAATWELTRHTIQENSPHPPYLAGT